MDKLESINEWMLFLSQDKHAYLANQDIEINLFGKPGKEYLQIAIDVKKNTWSEYVFFGSETGNRLLQILQSLNMVNFSLKTLISHIKSTELRDTPKGPGILLDDLIVSVNNYSAASD
ncbi:hypothetical protein ACJJIF_12265 [Microbulbifer sp. SSSA002]|uniref:hypothetical protein n=1 Tax=Microbulbifer sp. SSSA002 TaxID=3243376 RepID=UPI00403A6E41